MNQPQVSCQRAEVSGIAPLRISLHLRHYA
jgi:hypothetical protein